MDQTIREEERLVESAAFKNKGRHDSERAKLQRMNGKKTGVFIAIEDWKMLQKMSIVSGLG